MSPQDEKALSGLYSCKLMGPINIAALGGMRESTFITTKKTNSFKELLFAGKTFAGCELPFDLSLVAL